MYNNNIKKKKKVVHRELHKKMRFLENVMHKILWDFEIKIDHLILARRKDLVEKKERKRKKKRKKKERV